VYFLIKVKKCIKSRRGHAPEYISEQTKKGRSKQTLKRKGKMNTGGEHPPPYKKGSSWSNNFGGTLVGTDSHSCLVETNGLLFVYKLLLFLVG
jgi:hypothetical protein